LISISFIAYLPSQSSATACSKLGSPSYLLSNPVEADLSLTPTRRMAAPLALRSCRHPQTSCASRSIIAVSASIPAERQKRPKLVETCSHTSSVVKIVDGNALMVVI
jgi:hypothetical protein